MNARIGELITTPVPYLILGVVLSGLFLWAVFHNAAKKGRRKAFYLGFVASLPIVALASIWAITSTNAANDTVAQANTELRATVAEQYGLTIVNLPLDYNFAGKIVQNGDAIVMSGLNEEIVPLSFGPAGNPILDVSALQR